MPTVFPQNFTTTIIPIPRRSNGSETSNASGTRSTKLLCIQSTCLSSSLCLSFVHIGTANMMMNMNKPKKQIAKPYPKHPTRVHLEWKKWDTWKKCWTPSTKLQLTYCQHYCHIRTLALYSMVDESSDVLESGPTWKKNLTIQLFFYFFFQHVLGLFLKHVLLQVKNMLKIPKINQIQEFSIFIFFFPPTWTCQHILFFSFRRARKSLVGIRQP